MLENTLMQMLQARFPSAEITVEMEGNHCQVGIVDAEFESMRQIKRQQQVYSVLNEKIASGEVHAVHLNLRTPTEASAV